MENPNIDLGTSQLGIYDFFNVITSGAIMMALFYIVCPDFFTRFSVGEEICPGLVALAVIICFFIGLVFQELGAIAFPVREKAYRQFLNEEYANEHCPLMKFLRKIFKKQPNDIHNEITSNPHKLREYQRYASEILRENDLEFKRKVPYTEDQANYVFCQMEYRIAFIGKNEKVEKMRAVCSMARSLVVGMPILAFVTLLSELIYHNKNLFGISNWFLFFAFLALMFLFINRARKSIYYMIRLVLGLYGADYLNSLKQSEKHR